MSAKFSAPARLAALLWLLLGLVAVVQAQSVPSAIIEFPMVGVGFDQTFQVNVVNPDACDLQFVIFDQNGRVVAQQSEPGRKPWQDLQLTGIVDTPRRHVDVWVMVTAVRSIGQACRALGTVEVYDRFTRVSSVIVPQLPAVQAGPPFFGLGPVGVGGFQTVRLNVLAHPPSPCAGSLGFVDANGHPVGPTLAVNLNAGQAALLDLPGQLVVPDFFGRTEVLPQLTPIPGVAPGVCVTSVEVYDQFTGWTHAFYPPGPPN